MNKSVITAVLMIAVSAWGQSKPATSKAPEMCYDIDHWMPVNDKGSQPAVIAKYPCGHPEKRQCVGGCKPSPSPAVAIPKPHKPKPSVKTFKNTITPQLAKELASLPCDGLACGHTGLGDALPPDSFGPYEAAVPVEPQWTCTVTPNDIHCTKGGK